MARYLNPQQRRAMFAKLREKSLGKPDGVRYDHVKEPEDITAINQQIRAAISIAKERKELLKLYRQSMYLITLTKAGNFPWGSKHMARQEFTQTAKAINEAIDRLDAGKKLDISYG